MRQRYLVSLLDQVLVHTCGMAFGALGTSGPHKNCVPLFSPMMLAGSFRVYLFDMQPYT